MKDGRPRLGTGVVDAAQTCTIKSSTANNKFQSAHSTTQAANPLCKCRCVAGFLGQASLGTSATVSTTKVITSQRKCDCRTWRNKRWWRLCCGCQQGAIRVPDRTRYESLTQPGTQSHTHNVGTDWSANLGESCKTPNSGIGRHPCDVPQNAN